MPCHRMTHPPAARTLRYQSDRVPKVSGMKNTSPTSRAPAGVTYARPERRPWGGICATTPTCRRPATPRISGLSSRVSGAKTMRTKGDGAAGEARLCMLGSMVCATVPAAVVGFRGVGCRSFVDAQGAQLGGVHDDV